MIEAGKCQWKYEEVPISLLATQMLLVRIMIAKIENHDRLLQIMRGIPVRAGEEGWNCVGWVKEALLELQRDGHTLGTAVSDWVTVRDAAMGFVQKKKDEHRFDGVVKINEKRAATFDLITEKETIA